MGRKSRVTKQAKKQKAIGTKAVSADSRERS
jgi:hypothetical protein